MIRPEVLLRLMEAKQVDIAKQAMEQPRDGDTFMYGRACGLYAGLEMAREIVLDALRDEDERDL